ncbi:hypothetical protein C7E25_02930 [Stenotrophomonas maltophilia]|nr:hypothetical protein C7E25_02930 [Stenotrophomonas maltophilia]
MTWTPLHEAVVMGDVAALNAALAATIFPDPRDRHGQTPLHFAAHLGNVEAVSALLLAGASPNARDRHAQTPLHLAARSDHFGSSGPPRRLWLRWPMGAPGRPFTPLGSWRRGNGVTLPPRVRRSLPQALSQTPRIADTRRRSVWLTREL